MTTPSPKEDNQPTPTVPESVADVNGIKSQFRWNQVIELGYEESSDGGNNATNVENEEAVCFHCGKVAEQAESSKLSKCAKCQVASYCSRECQVSSWKGGEGKVGHKFSCAAYKRVGDDMMIIFGEDKDTARQDILSRIRFYAYPYAVYKASTTGGRGFLFVQSDSSLAVLSLPVPILSNGRIYSKQRSVLLHWLTMKEYDSEVCMDDFELAGARKELKTVVEEYDEKVEVPILMRFRCGHVAVGIAPLVPDFNLCNMLGKEYYGSGQGSGALQLNIDDM
ncbi:hypothetical protein ACHAXR_001471 [Thalassiosira sp. AJA248-18]